MYISWSPIYANFKPSSDSTTRWTGGASYTECACLCIYAGNVIVGLTESWLSLRGNKMGSLYSSVELVPSTSSVHLTIALTDSIHSNDLLNQLGNN